MGIPCACIALLAYPQGGVIQGLNTEFRRIYRNKVEASAEFLSVKEEKELHCYVHNCRNMNVEFGGFYYFNKSTIFSYFDIIVNNTINMLITFS